MIEVYIAGVAPAVHAPLAALCLVSCGSCTHIDMCVSYICLLHLNSVRYFPVRESNGGDIHVYHELNVAFVIS